MASGAADAARATGAPAFLGSGNPKVSYAIGLIIPDNDQIRATWTPTPPAEGEPLKWHGPCFACTHQHTVEVPDHVIEGVLLQDADPVSVQVRLFSCLCPNLHNDRPDGVRGGCGRYWLGRVEHYADDDYAISVETDLRLLSQAQALDDALRSQDVRATTLAEKWVGGLTALLGLLSVSSVVTGADAAKAVRADLRWLVFAAAVLALASAVAALVFAYRAAGFGSARNASVQNQADQDRWYRRLRSTGPRAVQQLRTSFVLTLVSLLFIFTVGGLLWFLPREKPTDQCVVQGHGTCQVR